jgi:hypothetical protein
MLRPGMYQGKIFGWEGANADSCLLILLFFYSDGRSDENEVEHGGEQWAEYGQRGGAIVKVLYRK